MDSTTSEPKIQPWHSVLRTQLRHSYESDNPLPVALAYLALLALAELVTVFLAPQPGVFPAPGRLFLLLLHSALVWQRPLHRLLLSLAFVPLIRVVSMSLPLTGFPLVSWYAITSVPLFVAAGVVMHHLKLGWRGLGLGAGAGGLLALPLQLLIGASGLALGYVEYIILKPEPLVEAFTWQAIWLPALILLISTGYLEELIFRGLMQQAAVEQLGRRQGILYVALFFAVLHAGYLSLLDVLFVLAVGLLFGLVVQRTGSLLGVTLGHGLTNITLFLIMPFVAAGVEFPRLPLAQAGPPPASALVESAIPVPTATASALPTATVEVLETAGLPVVKPTVLLPTVTLSSIPAPRQPPAATPTTTPLDTPTVEPTVTLTSSSTAPGGKVRAPVRGSVETPATRATVPPTVSPLPPTDTPAVTPAPLQASTTSAQHRVQPGQTLAFLARYYQTTGEAIRTLNGLAGETLLVVGQQLRLPVPREEPIVPTGQFIIVQSGDTLSRIARDRDTTVETLILLNWLPDPDRIIPGQLLWLPAEPGSASPPPEE